MNLRLGHGLGVVLDKQKPIRSLHPFSEVALDGLLGSYADAPTSYLRPLPYSRPLPYASFYAYKPGQTKERTLTRRSTISNRTVYRFFLLRNIPERLQLAERRFGV